MSWHIGCTATALHVDNCHSVDALLVQYGAFRSLAFFRIIPKVELKSSEDCYNFPKVV